MRMALTALAASLLVPSPVSAQPALRDIAALQVAVEALDTDSRECGLNQSSLENWALKALVDNRLQPVAQSNPYLYLQVTTGQSPHLCVSSIRVAIRGSFVISDGHLTSPVTDEVSLIEKGGINWSRAYDHPDRIRKVVAELVGQIATAIRKANAQPEPGHTSRPNGGAPFYFGSIAARASRSIFSRASLLIRLQDGARSSGSPSVVRVTTYSCGAVRGSDQSK